MLVRPVRLLGDPAPVRAGGGWARESWAGFADLVLGLDCAGCGRPGTGWCVACERGLLGPLVPGPSARVGVPVVACAPYDGAVRAALIAHKEHGRLALVGPLGDALARAVRGLGVRGPVRLVPVPSSPAAVRRRGHDHALRLARRAGRALRDGEDRVRVEPWLRSRGSVRDQVGLGVDQRRVNKESTTVARRAAGRGGPLPVVVVDDLVTTGASLAASVGRLRAAGVGVVGAATVAAVELRSTGHHPNRGVGPPGPPIA